MRVRAAARRPRRPAARPLTGSGSASPEVALDVNVAPPRPAALRSGLIARGMGAHRERGTAARALVAGSREARYASRRRRASPRPHTGRHGARQPGKAHLREKCRKALHRLAASPASVAARRAPPTLTQAASSRSTNAPTGSARARDAAVEQREEHERRVATRISSRLPAMPTSASAPSSHAMSAREIRVGTSLAQRACSRASAAHFSARIITIANVRPAVVSPDSSNEFTNATGPPALVMRIATPARPQREHREHGAAGAHERPLSRGFATGRLSSAAPIATATSAAPRSPARHRHRRRSASDGCTQSIRAGSPTSAPAPTANAICALPRPRTRSADSVSASSAARMATRTQRARRDPPRHHAHDAGDDRAGRDERQRDPRRRVFHAIGWCGDGVIAALASAACSRRSGPGGSAIPAGRARRARSPRHR